MIEQWRLYDPMSARFAKQCILCNKFGRQSTLSTKFDRYPALSVSLGRQSIFWLVRQIFCAFWQICQKSKRYHKFLYFRVILLICITTWTKSRTPWFNNEIINIDIDCVTCINIWIVLIVIIWRKWNLISQCNKFWSWCRITMII
jgi:hypothetical protein